MEGGKSNKTCVTNVIVKEQKPRLSEKYSEKPSSESGPKHVDGLMRDVFWV